MDFKYFEIQFILLLIGFSDVFLWSKFWNDLMSIHKITQFIVKLIRRFLICVYLAVVQLQFIGHHNSLMCGQRVQFDFFVVFPSFFGMCRDESFIRD